jgi:hypothetical protein
VAATEPEQVIILVWSKSPYVLNPKSDPETRDESQTQTLQWCQSQKKKMLKDL